MRCSFENPSPDTPWRNHPMLKSVADQCQTHSRGLSYNFVAKKELGKSTPFHKSVSSRQPSIADMQTSIVLMGGVKRRMESETCCCTNCVSAFTASLGYAPRLPAENDIEESMSQCQRGLRRSPYRLKWGETIRAVIIPC